MRARFVQARGEDGYFVNKCQGLSTYPTPAALKDSQNPSSDQPISYSTLTLL